MNRHQFWLLILLVAAPTPATAVDCELQLDVATPVADLSGVDPRLGTLPDVSTGFPAVTIGVFSGAIAGVAGDNRCGIVAQYDRISWRSHSFSSAALQVAWRHSLASQRAWMLWASIYAGPSWYDSDFESTRQPQHLSVLDIAWRIAPAIEFSLPRRRGATLVAGLRYVQYLNRETEISPFESGLVCYVGTSLRLN